MPDDTLTCAVQKPLNRTRCRTRSGDGSMCYMAALWRLLANTIEPSVRCGDAALCQISLTTCLLCGYSHYTWRRVAVRGSCCAVSYCTTYYRPHRRVQCAMLRKFSDENQFRPVISLAFMETYCEFIHCAAEYHLVKRQTLIGLNNFGRNVYETSWLEIAVK